MLVEGLQRMSWLCEHVWVTDNWGCLWCSPHNFVLIALKDVQVIDSVASVKA